MRELGTTPEGLRIVELTDEREPVAEDALGVILVSIPPHDRHPTGMLRNQLRETREGSVAPDDYHMVAILDEAGKLRNPLMLHIGESDPWTPLDVRKQLDGVLSGFAHVTSYLYPKTDHAFAREGASTDVPA